VSQKTKQLGHLIRIDVQPAVTEIRPDSIVRPSLPAGFDNLVDRVFVATEIFADGFLLFASSKEHPGNLELSHNFAFGFAIFFVRHYN
jgi:hypothetical protein